MPQRASIAIHLIVAALIAIPFRYYVSDDKRDERFAWRMFSPIRVERCNTQFFLGDAQRPIKASKYFHNAWINIASRGRKNVVEAMAAKLCQLHPETEVRVRMLCEERPGIARENPTLWRASESSEDIEVVSSGLFDLCETKRL